MKLEERLMKTVLEQVAKRAAEQQLNEEQINELVETAIKAMTTDGLEKASGFLADTLRQQIPEMIAQENTMQTGFEQRLYERWKKALDLYDAIVILTRECGEHYTKQHREQSAKDKDNIFGVLVHIHVKACQTASAVGVLLKSGYARDALARQRTLHELAATALFIKKHGQEIAERYWLHNTIESYKAVSQYEQYCKRLGYDPHDPADLEKLRSQRDALIARFGRAYSEQYGWAAQALNKTRGVSFADIEENVGLHHLRPYYRMASHGVHANPKGLIFDIGNINKEIPGYHRPMLAGASNAGLLTLKNDLETLMKVKVLDSFVHEACQAFIEIHRELMREEEEQIKAMQAQENSSC